MTQNNRADKLIEKIRSAEAPNEDDRKELALILENRSMQKVLNMFLAQSDELLVMLTNQDLSTDAGVKDAIAIQQRCRVFTSVVEELCEWATQEPEPTIEKDEPNA